MARTLSLTIADVWKPNNTASQETIEGGRVDPPTSWHMAGNRMIAPIYWFDRKFRFTLNYSVTGVHWDPQGEHWAEYRIYAQGSPEPVVTRKSSVMASQGARTMATEVLIRYLPSGSYRIEAELKYRSGILVTAPVRIVQFFHTSAAPNTPTTTSPRSGTSVLHGQGASSRLDFTWEHSDPDAFDQFTDRAGWEIQRREWNGKDWGPWVTPFVRKLINGQWTRSYGWAIRDSPRWNTYNVQSIVLSMNPGTPAQSAGTSVVLDVPSTADFQVRVRTFDNMARTLDPVAAEAAGAASTWSGPVTVRVIGSYLPPLPEFPINDSAVALGCEEIQVTHSWAGGAGNSVSSRFYDGDLESQNLLPNPRLMANASGWTASGAVTNPGSDRTTIATSFQGTATIWTNTPWATVTPGSTYQVTWESITPTTGQEATVAFYDSNSVELKSQTALATGLATNQWVRKVAKGFEAPEGADYARVTIRKLGPSGTTFELRRARFSPESDDLSYFDGDTPSKTICSPENAITFGWIWRDPRNPATFQAQRRIRVRKQGTEAWTELIPLEYQFTSAEDQMATRFTAVNGEQFLFEPGFRYEWEAMTGSFILGGGIQQGLWSPTQTFWVTPLPGSGPVIPDPAVTFPDRGLGCGHNRAFLFTRGGEVLVGELRGIESLSWERVRDEVSEASVTIELDKCSESAKKLLADARCWLNELVIFRDNGEGMKRVWEGPVTLITYRPDSVDISARDVMVYPYRRAMRLGYNDAYVVRGRTYNPNGTIKDQGIVVSEPKAVTERSLQILMDSLAYDDPNVLQYLTMIRFDDDARQSRVVPDWSRTAYQQVDDLAAKAGMDYTTVGRRIIIWDTHRPVGRLPELRDGDFDSAPIVSEYGMQAANVYAVTNNSGVYGVAERLEMREQYGHIEMIASAWGESDSGGDEETLTEEAKARLEISLREQAERNVASRWPVPVVVRVPDNARLMPDAPIDISALVPGVHIPLRSTSTLRPVAQMQKLDRVRVAQSGDEESVQVTLSPAPSEGEDPDDSGGGEG